MTDTVKKIFTVLAVVVICVVVAAFAINILVPNALVSVVNAVEDTVKSATGLGIDLNGDGTAGKVMVEGQQVRDTGDSTNQDRQYEKANTVQGFTGTNG